MYLLDTNACLDFLLARNLPLAERVNRETEKLVVSAITAAELRVGNKTSADPLRDAELVDDFLTIIEVALFDQAAASAYGRIARSHGVDRHSFDRLIAAHAIALGAVLVTANGRHFRNMPMLRFEDWRQF